MELFESLWLAIVAIPIGMAFTWPAWLVGRVCSFIRPGGTQQLWVTRTSRNRWVGFSLGSIVTLMLAIGLKTTGASWLIIVIAATSLVTYFFAFMLGLGARDWRALNQEPDRAHLQESRLDAMDHELIDMIDKGRAA